MPSPAPVSGVPSPSTSSPSSPSTPTSSSFSSSSSAPASSTSTPSSSSDASPKPLKSGAVFKAISQRINADTVAKVKASYRFDLTPDDGGAAQSWLIDLKAGTGVVQTCTGSDKADCVIGMKDGDFVQLMTGKLNPQTAFMKGKLKVKGNIMLAQKLSALMPSKPSSSKARPASSGKAQQQQKEQKEQKEQGKDDKQEQIKSKL